MTIKPSPKDKKPADKKPAAGKPAPKPAAQAGAKPDRAASTTGLSGPDRELAARDMRRGLGGGGGFLWALLALAVVAGAGAATVGVWMPKLAETLTTYQAPPVDPRLAPVAERVQALENEQKAQVREKVLEKSREAAPPPSADGIKEIVRRLTKMETRLTALRKMVGAARPPETARTAVQSLQRLSGRLQSLERNREEVDAILKRIAATDRSLPGDEKEKPGTETVAGGRELVAAAGKLNRRIESDKPFADALAQVKRLAGAAGTDRDMAANIAVLEPLAPSGVRTLDQLRRQFPAAAAAVLRVKSSPPRPLRAGTGWWDKTINKLAAMVSLRRQGKQGEQGERDAPRLVAAAEKALSENSGENNISAAISALEGLSGRRLAAASAWLGQARRREAAEKAASALNLFALTRLAALVAANNNPEKASAAKASEVTAAPEKAAPEKAAPEKAKE